MPDAPFFVLIANMSLNKYWGKIKNQLQNKKRIIFLGEIHGAKINSAIIDEFVNKLEINVIMVELESKWEKSFLYLKKGQKEKFIKSFKKEDWIFQSGLIGDEHIKLFSKYLKEGEKIIPIKIENKNWNISESRTSKNIKSILEANPNKNLLLIMGKLHARKKPFLFNFNNKIKRLIPTGFNIGKYSINIQIRYGNGEIYNFGKVKIYDKFALRYFEKNSGGLIKSHSQYFDYDFIVPNTQAINPIKIK